MAKNFSFGSKDFTLWAGGHEKLIWLYKHQPDNKDVQNHELVRQRNEIPYLKTTMYDRVDRLFQSFIEKRYSALTGHPVTTFNLSDTEVNLSNEKKKTVLENHMKAGKAIMHAKVADGNKVTRMSAIVANEKGSYDLVIFYYAIADGYTDTLRYNEGNILTHTATTIFERDTKKVERIQALDSEINELRTFHGFDPKFKEQIDALVAKRKSLDYAIEVSDLKEKMLRATFTADLARRSFGKDFFTNVYVCFMNKSYIKKEFEFEKIDASKYFLMASIKDSLTEISDETWKSFDDINIESEAVFNKKYPYRGENYVEYFGKNLKDSGSIYDIPRITAPNLRPVLLEFFNRGILKLENIPSKDYGLLKPKSGGLGTSLPIAMFHSKENVVMEMLKEAGYSVFNVEGGARSFVATESLKEWMDALVFPLFFIDYETVMTPLPMFPNMPPMAPVMAQYSVHVLNEDGTTEHFDGLLNNYEHSLDRLVESMQKGVGKRKGTYISWNKSFEMGRNTFLADYYSEKPEIKNFFLDMNARMVDLLDVFRGFGYYDTRFNGSFSIKRVFPVISPDRNYAGLEIAHGDDASEAILKLFDKAVTDQEKDNIRRRLREYNTLDTEAMLIIYNHLKKFL